MDAALKFFSSTPLSVVFVFINSHVIIRFLLASRSTASLMDRSPDPSFSAVAGTSETIQQEHEGPWSWVERVLSGSNHEMVRSVSRSVQQDSNYSGVGDCELRRPPQWLSVCAATTRWWIWIRPLSVILRWRKSSLTATRGSDELETRA